MIYPDGEVITYTHNQAGQVEQLDSSRGQSYLSQADYNPAGLLTGQQLGGSISQTFGYYSNTFRPQRATAGSALGTRQSLNLSFDNLGRLTNLTDTLHLVSGAPTYLTYDQYDALNRLRHVASNLNQQNYSYDNLGNVTAIQGRSFSYNSGRPHLPSSDLYGWNYSYDDNGNLSLREIV